MTVKERYELIKQNVLKACAESGRKADEVEIIGVTKTRTIDEINQAIECGIRIVGENRVQELLEKYDGIDKRAQVHLIGQLQTNKVKYIIDKVSLIHSLDRVSLASELNRLGEKKKIKVNALVEVNIGYEDTKSGVLPNKLTEYLDILQDFLYIKPIGLMTVAPANATDDQLNEYFGQMQQLLVQGQNRFGSSFKELSMGMSRDYVPAVKHGATMIRIGTGLFGARNYNI